MMEAGFTETINFLLILSYTAYCAYTDFKFRRISLKISMLFLIGALLLKVLEVFIYKKGYTMDFPDFLYPFIPGFFLAIISVLCRGAIGMGDAIFIFVCGFYYTVSEMVAILMLTWAFVLIFALVLIVSKKGAVKAVRKKELPFITLAFPVMLVVLILRYF